MELIKVKEVALLVNKTPSMVYYLANVKGIFTKYPTGKQGGSPEGVYLLDKNEVVSYFQNKEPRKDYSNFLQTASVIVDGEEYVSTRSASLILGLSENRARYLAMKYSVKTTEIATPNERGSKIHSLICLPEIKQIYEVESKIAELRDSLPKKLDN